MKKYLIHGAILLFCLFLLSTCVSFNELRVVERLVPSDAPFYIHVGNMDRLMSSIDAFIEPLGVKSVTGGMPVKTMLKNLFISMGSDFKFENLDFKKPWGVAINPQENLSGLVVEILVPLIEPEKNFEPFKAFVSNLRECDVVLEGDYAVVFAMGDKPAEFPPKKGINLADLEKFPDASLSAWINIKGALERFAINVTDFKKSLLEAMSVDSDKAGAANGIRDKLVSGLFGLIEELEVYSFNIQVDKNGLTTRSNLRVTKGKSIDKMCASLSGYKGVTEYTKYIPSKYLYSLSAHVDPEFFGKVAMAIYKPIIEAVNLPPADKADIDELLKNALATKTSRISIAVDVDADFANPSALGQSLLKALFKKLGDSFAINIIDVTEARDKELYRTSIEKVTNSPVLAKFFNAMTGELGVEGIGISYLANYVRDKKVGDILCDELGFGIKLTEKEIPPKRTALDPVLAYKSRLLASDVKEAMEIAKSFFDKYKLLLHFSNNKCYMVMGKNAENVIQEVAKHDAYPDANLFSVLATHGRQREMFDSAQLGTHFSVLRLLEMMKTMPEVAGAIDLKATGKETGITGASRYADGRWESVSIWNIDEMKSLFDEMKKSFNLGDLFKL